jgi:hypothetical protein
LNGGYSVYEGVAVSDGVYEAVSLNEAVCVIDGVYEAV